MRAKNSEYSEYWILNGHTIRDTFISNQHSMYAPITSCVFTFSTGRYLFFINNIAVAAVINYHKHVNWPHTYPYINHIHIQAYRVRSIDSRAHIKFISYLCFARHSIRDPCVDSVNACAAQNESLNRYVDTCATIVYVAISSVSHSKRMAVLMDLMDRRQIPVCLTIYFSVLFTPLRALSLSLSQTLYLSLSLSHSFALSKWMGEWDWIMLCCCGSSSSASVIIRQFVHEFPYENSYSSYFVLLSCLRAMLIEEIDIFHSIYFIYFNFYSYSSHFICFRSRRFKAKE